jgi:GTPase
MVSTRRGQGFYLRPCERQHQIVSIRDDDLPFVLKVESAFRITGRPGTVITGVIEQGTLHIGDHLELIQPSSAGAAAALRFECTGFDAAPRVTGRDPALEPLIGIVGIGVEPDVIRPGARLQIRRDDLARKPSLGANPANNLPRPWTRLNTR